MQVDGLIDCDVHPFFQDGLRDLAPYLTETWRRRLGVAEAAYTSPDHAVFPLPLNMLYVNSAPLRTDAEPESSIPASDAAAAARELLDRHAIARAVLISGRLMGIGAMPDRTIANALAAAYNDWMTERWLQADERWRGALVVAPQDPEGAAREIERVGDRPGMVAVYLPHHGVALGEPHYHPILEAAQRHALPVCLHPSGTESVYANAPAMALAPTYYLEWHAALGQIFQSHTLSLLSHGTFERFPELKVVMVEGGFLWAAETMWRLDRNWQARRAEVPWIRKPPSDYLFDHIRFTTQPFIEPPDDRHVAAALEMVQAERTLVYSSDYPHWDFDDPKRALAKVPADMRRRICVDNPRALFGDRLL